jgi:hypothetical protein
LFSTVSLEEISSISSGHKSSILIFHLSYKANNFFLDVLKLGIFRIVHFLGTSPKYISGLSHLYGNRCSKSSLDSNRVLLISAIWLSIQSVVANSSVISSLTIICDVIISPSLTYFLFNEYIRTLPENLSHKDF